MSLCSTFALAVASLSIFTSVAAADAAPSNPPIDVAEDGRPVAPVIPGATTIPTRAAVRAALAARRAKNLVAFHAYRTAETYPSNVYVDGARNVWRDQDGHLCAAATIINKSGATELVGRTADNNNFIKLADVHSGALLDWMQTSGFTRDEMILIQRPMMPVVQKPVEKPEAKIAISAKLRRAETQRLAKLYAAIESTLTAQREHSLDVATDLLMQRPDLAAALVPAT